MSESVALALPHGRGQRREQQLASFADAIVRIGREIGFKVSSRGWCYQLEQYRVIDKSQFDKVQDLVNECRQKGLIPIDFVLEDDARAFSGVEMAESESPVEYMKRWLEGALECEDYYTPDWWEGEECYLQMIVEKVDLKSLFEPVCHQYHIPIATTKGWSSMLQRATYAKRFREAEERGLKCVLLYCGDHDPDGLRISDFLRKNLYDLMNVSWSDGTQGYDPANLVIERFGLNYDFIVKNALTWIDNLITGTGGNLASPSHRNHWLPYVQEYLKAYGPRKCEGNAIVTRREQGRDLCRRTIEKHLGRDALERFKAKRRKVQAVLRKFRKKTGLQTPIEEALKIIQRSEGAEEKKK